MSDDAWITLLLVGAVLVAVALCLVIGCCRRSREECDGGVHDMSAHGATVEPGPHAWWHVRSGRRPDDGNICCSSSTDSDQSLSTAQQMYAPSSMYLQSRLHTVD
ncbi:unnamed protein product [Urochloa decumbens]|uniref:Secreted protein n=1 Tax=Urochloa decumbens TaxID=240449 RepID=A0ABC9ACK0_9POAL